MAFTTTTGAALLRPETVSALIVEPTIAASAAAAVATVVFIDGHELRIPKIATDASAGWYAESADITPSDMAAQEVAVVPGKLAGLVIASNESINDTSPAAAAVIGQSLVRDIARKLDAAYFGNLSAPAPAGLGSLTGVIAISAGAAFDSLDIFETAISSAAVAGADITAFAVNPADMLALGTLKESTGSKRNLLAADPADPTRRQVAGRPLVVSTAVPAGTIYGIPRDREFVVVRQDAQVVVDASRYLERDSVGIRCVMRVGFGHVSPSTIVRITKTA